MGHPFVNLKWAEQEVGVFANHNDRVAEPQGTIGGVGGGPHKFEDTVWT